MGNSLAGGKCKKKRTTKVMKISGETLKLKTPVTAAEVVKDYPGHVLLESEAVKHFGVRARPLEGQQTLEPRRLYFLVELPKDQGAPRRVRSGIQMSAQDRLESLVLARRSASDLSIMKSTKSSEGENEDVTRTRVKMRLPRAEVERLLKESETEAEAAAKIVDLCLLDKEQRHWCDIRDTNDNNNVNSSVPGGEGFKSSKKRVSFLPIKEVRQIAVAS